MSTKQTNNASSRDPLSSIETNLTIDIAEEVDNLDSDKQETDIDSMPFYKHGVKKQLSNERYSNNTKQRKSLVRWTKIIISLWLFLVIGMVYLCAFKKCGLDNSVLCTLLATTTANVLGLGYIIVKGLFNVPEELTD